MPAKLTRSEALIEKRRMRLERKRLGRQGRRERAARELKALKQYLAIETAAKLAEERAQAELEETLRARWSALGISDLLAECVHVMKEYRALRPWLGSGPVGQELVVTPRFEANDFIDRFCSRGPVKPRSPSGRQYIIRQAIIPAPVPYRDFHNETGDFHPLAQLEIVLMKDELRLGNNQCAIRFSAPSDITVEMLVTSVDDFVASLVRNDLTGLRRRTRDWGRTETVVRNTKYWDDGRIDRTHYFSMSYEYMVQGKRYGHDITFEVSPPGWKSGHSLAWDEPPYINGEQLAVLYRVSSPNLHILVGPALLEAMRALHLTLDDYDPDLLAQTLALDREFMHTPLRR